MKQGLLDLPAPLLDWVEAWLAASRLPAIVHVFAWGILAGWIGMWVYRRTSHQERLTAIRRELAGAQRALANYDGEFRGLMPLIGRQFGLAFRQMGVTVMPALLAGLPLLFMLPWLSNQFESIRPGARAPIEVCAIPAEISASRGWDSATPATSAGPGCWEIAWPGRGQMATLREGNEVLLDLPSSVPVTVVHRHYWLNALIGNPAGYLPDSVETQSVHIDLPELELHALGPIWLRGWEAAFFFAALIPSLILKSQWRLH
ncbi:MAG: hypothetical protein ABI451_11720 [Dokdonella sp.]